jgi:hypothetical protein
MRFRFIVSLQNSVALQAAMKQDSAVERLRHAVAGSVNVLSSDVARLGRERPQAGSSTVLVLQS